MRFVIRQLDGGTRIVQRLGSYRLVEKITDQGGTTYDALDENSQEQVYLHVVPGDAESHLRALLSKKKAGLLDVQRENGQLYAITNVIPDFVSFADWLKRPSIREATPAEDTVDRAIRDFVIPDPPAPPPPAPVDEVKELFKALPTATEWRGQKPSSPAPKPTAYASPVAAGSASYTELIEPKRRPAAAVPVSAAVAEAAPADSKMAERVARLEKDLAFLKMTGIIALCVVAVCLVILFLRNR